MKLALFNRWKDFTTWSGHTLQYQTSKKATNYITYIRDKESGANIIFGVAPDKETSLQRAIANVRKIGVEGVKRAISTGQMQVADHTPKEPKDVEWRDGINHRHRAQKKIVGSIDYS